MFSLFTLWCNGAPSIDCLNSSYLENMGLEKITQAEGLSTTSFSAPLIVCIHLPLRLNGLNKGNETPSVMIKHTVEDKYWVFTHRQRSATAAILPKRDRCLPHTLGIHCLLAWEPVSVPKHGYCFWQQDGTKGTKRTKKTLSVKL